MQETETYVTLAVSLFMVLPNDCGDLECYYENTKKGILNK